MVTRRSLSWTYRRAGPTLGLVRRKTGDGDGPRRNRPPRAKLALLTWGGAYAVILLVLAIAGPAMGRWPLAVRALVLSGLMVAAMTWVIVPVMTRLFRGWLS